MPGRTAPPQARTAAGAGRARRARAGQKRSAALFSLNPELHLILTLKYVEGYSLREIAQMLQTSEYAIKGKLYRGREKLHAALKEQEV